MLTYLLTYCIPSYHTFQWKAKQYHTFTLHCYNFTVQLIRTTEARGDGANWPKVFEWGQVILFAVRFVNFVSSQKHSGVQYGTCLRPLHIFALICFNISIRIVRLCPDPDWGESHHIVPRLPLFTGTPLRRMWRDASWPEGEGKKVVWNIFQTPCHLLQSR